MVHPLTLRRQKVNGRALRNYLDEPITILGEVMKVNVPGNSFDIRTTDNCMIHVLSIPRNVVPDGWVEIRGRASGKTLLHCYHLTQFSYGVFKKFNRKAYDDLMVVLNTFDNPLVNGESDLD